MPRRRPWKSVYALVGLLGLWGPAAAQDSSRDLPEVPLALVVAAKDARMLRAGSELSLSVQPGDLLFAGDSLRSERGFVTFISCTAKTRQTLPPEGDVLFEVRGPKTRAGKVSDESSVAGCFLPALPRSIVASQQHAGAAVAREASTAGAAQTLQQRMQQLPEAQRNQIAAGLAPIDAAIRADPGNPLNHLARVEILDRSGLSLDAADEMRMLTQLWPDAGWVRSRLFVLEEKAGKAIVAGGPSEPEVEGNTYVLLVGISSFKDPNIAQLNYAHEDAIELARLIESPRAGEIPADNVMILVNQRATRSAIQSAIETHLKGRAGKNDTILLFIASHGATIPTENGNKGFIVTYDSDPQDLATTGIPMDDIRKLFETQLSGVKRLLLYADVCHAGHIGQIVSKADLTNKVAERALSSEDLQMFGLLAAQKGQVAVEGVNYGGGHGAFSYFLMRALNGDADLNNDGKVTMPELADYVHDKVSDATFNKQIPKQIGDIDETRVMSLTGKPGIVLKDYAKPVLQASRGIGVSSGSVAVPPSTSRTLKYQDAADLIRQFEDAVEQSRILPADDQSAFTFLGALRARLQAGDYSVEAEKLRVALEDRGQEVLLQYLAGEAAPQNRARFFSGTAYFEAAQLLAPESLYLQSRMVFCQGRVAVFDKDYALAITLLERAIRLDPERAYSYNALGIAYLERAQYEQAILAFRDAIRRAPYWVYPQHNLALAYAESGQYDRATRTYQEAMNLGPSYSYLPYNLGLLYQRNNRLGDAEQSYRNALRIEQTTRGSATSTQPWTAAAVIVNALGSVEASRSGHRNRDHAEKFFRQALQYDAEFRPARHNLALILSRDHQSPEAERLWRQNLAADPGDIASHLALAEYLDRIGRKEEAASEYTLAIAGDGAYPGIRRKLAAVYLELNRFDDARSVLQRGLQLAPASPNLLEDLGDVEARAGQMARAEELYREAEDDSSGSSDKTRIRQKRDRLSRERLVTPRVP